MAVFRLSSKLTTAATIVGFGLYVNYNDVVRYRRIIDKFETGNILPPYLDNHNEPVYLERPNLERQITQILSPRFSNHYYYVGGPTGSGKSRLIIEVLRRLNEQAAKTKTGGPIYVSVTQGQSFPETLADAIGFKFDEHINFTFILNMVFGVRSIPTKEAVGRVARVLNAIEMAAFEYSKRYGKPAILVLDDVQLLKKRSPVMLEYLQEKAKLWADLNLVKVVFVASGSETAMFLQKDPSGWSRADTALVVPSLTEQETCHFLTKFDNARSQTRELTEHNCKTLLDETTAKIVYKKVGGKIRDLISLKYDLKQGDSLEASISRLQRNRMKSLLCQMDLSKIKNIFKTCSKQRSGKISLNEALKVIDYEDLLKLTDHDVLNLEIEDQNVSISLDPLTEGIVETMLREN